MIIGLFRFEQFADNINARQNFPDRHIYTLQLLSYFLWLRPCALPTGDRRNTCQGGYGPVGVSSTLAAARRLKRHAQNRQGT